LDCINHLGLLDRPHVLPCRGYERLNFGVRKRLQAGALACTLRDCFKLVDLAHVHRNLNGIRTIIALYWR
jgi:hypothetical protein